MSILERIKEDRLLFRKESSDKELIGWATSLQSEVEAVGKDKGNRPTTDEEAIAKIKSFIKQIDVTLDELNKKGLTDRAIEVEREKAFYVSYLPKALSEEELTAEIKQIISEKGLDSPKSMGVVMGLLKANFNGQFDGKAASSITRELLAN